MASLDLSRLSILVVDDNSFMRSIIEQALKALGVRRITSAIDGEDALNRIDACQPDIIMTDWEMEPMDGIQFVTRLRGDPSSPHRYTPIFMVTGYSELGRVTEARNAGISEYIVKPISAYTLYKRLEKTILNPRPFVEVVGGYFGPERRRRDQNFPGENRRGTKTAALEDFETDASPKNLIAELDDGLQDADEAAAVSSDAA